MGERREESLLKWINDYYVSLFLSVLGDDMNLYGILLMQKCNPFFVWIKISKTNSQNQDFKIWQPNEKTRKKMDKFDAPNFFVLPVFPSPEKKFLNKDIINMMMLGNGQKQNVHVQNE